MDLFEYQARDLFEKHGVPVLAGAVATTPAEAEANVDIVCGTHALLGKRISLKDLSLDIIDEEQHFGVSHQQKQKQLRQKLVGKLL